MIFRRETEGSFKVEVAGGDGGGVDGTGNGTEGGVVVVRCDAISRFEVNQFRDVLVPVKGVEKLVVAGVRKHKQWTCSYGFGGVPHKEINLRIVVNKAMEFSHAKPLQQFCLC